MAMNLCDGGKNRPHGRIVYENQPGGCPLCFALGDVTRADDRIDSVKKAVEATDLAIGAIREALEKQP